MKIAFIRKKYTPYGGAERYVETLIELLCKKGHEVHIFAEEWKCPPRPSGPLQNAPCFHKIPTVKGLSVLEVLSFAINARRLLRKRRFDIIHSFERTLYQDIYRAGDGCHKEWLIQRAKYEPFWKTWTFRFNPLHCVILWIEKQIFNTRNTRMVIVNSTRGSKEIRAHYRFPPERILVIHNGVDSSRFNVSSRESLRHPIRKSYGLRESDSVLLFLGSGFRRKGLEFALKALACLANPGVLMLVCGRDNPRKYRQLARSWGIEDRVLFVGPTKHPEKLYAAADIFILPTVYEPFSNACLEALSCGIPVITTSINGVSDLIAEKENGICLDDPSDIPGIVAAIEHFLSKRGTPTPIVKVPPYFSLEEHARWVTSVYNMFTAT